MRSSFKLASALVSLSLISHPFAQAETPASSVEKIPLKFVITKFPQTSLDFLSKSFSKEAIPGWALVLSSTAILHYYDEDLLLSTQKTGRRWGISNFDRTETVWRVGEVNILRLPTDTSSSLYFMGDGWLDMAIAGGFFSVGYFGDHVRPYNTSLQLVHGMFVSAVFDQLLKRSFGRQSPTNRTAPRGKWHMFPSFNAYNNDTASFDAMPSGHIMTSTLMFTIIRSNYPEYDAVLFPLEMTWLTALGFAMVNNGVHWASDYPLGIAMGYMIGKSSTLLGQTKPSQKTATNWQFMPGSDEYGNPMVTAFRAF